MADGEPTDETESSNSPVRYLDERRQRERLESALHEWVLAGDMTAAEADKIADAQGTWLFEGQDWAVSMDDADWPLAFAVLWIAWRDKEHTLAQWDRFRRWAGNIWRDPVSEGQVETLEAAGTELWKQLKSGKIHAKGLSRDGSDYVEIPVVQWLNLEWMPDHRKASVRNFAHPDARYRLVMVDSCEVMSIWSARNQASLTTNHQKVSEQARIVLKNLGGNPGKWDWDAMWIEVVRLAVDDKIKDRRTLTEQLLSWFAKKYDAHPSDSMLREKMKRLFETLGWK